MEKLFDRLILLIVLSFMAVKTDTVSAYTTISVIIVITLVSVNIAFDYMKVHAAVYILYIILTIFCPELVYYLPVICYDLLGENKLITAAAVIAAAIRIREISYLTMLYILFMLVLAYVLKMRLKSLSGSIKQAYDMRDEIRVSMERLAGRSRELMERQDYEIENATLNERNRIAREIHDTVGHLLSSSILQIGALIAVTKDDAEKKQLTQIKDTLTEGMDSIRSSIHNIHENSMNLESKIYELADNYSFCPVNINYKIHKDFSMKQKYTILFVVKEAMTNTMKHSDATAINMLFAELPGFYKIVIEDNGTGKSGTGEAIADNGKSMGLTGMYERIMELDGILNIENKKGYRIYITMPKNSERV